MSVCVSLLLVIYKIAFPRITTLGKLPGSSVYRCALAAGPLGREAGAGLPGGVIYAGRQAGRQQMLWPRSRHAAAQSSWHSRRNVRFAPPGQAALSECPPSSSRLCRRMFSAACRPAAHTQPSLSPPRRSTKMYPNAEVQPGMLMLRIDGAPGWIRWVAQAALLTLPAAPSPPSWVALPPVVAGQPAVAAGAPAGQPASQLDLSPSCGLPAPQPPSSSPTSSPSSSLCGRRWPSPRSGARRWATTSALSSST